jgi:GGDEF domain-containing protein
MVAAKISAISGGGKAFRYGGEEFTIVFAGKTPDQTEAHLNALRQTIENYSMVLREKRKKNDKEGKSKRGKSKSQQKTLSVTISIGLAERNKARKTPEEVIKAADLALYRAKRAGRNCVSR